MVREQGRYAQKASAGKELAQEIRSVLPQNEAGLSGVTEFGIRNVEFGIICFAFCDSAFRTLHSAFWVARPVQEMRGAS